MVHPKSISRLATVIALAVICLHVRAMAGLVSASNKSGKGTAFPFDSFKVQVSHPKQETLLLPPGRENACARKLTLKDEIECFQVALEAYYGRNFTEYCPGFAEYIAFSGCEACPWHKLNVDAISKPQVLSLPLNKTFFVDAAADCSVADHVRRYNNRYAVINYVSIMTIIASILLFFSSVYGALVSSDELVLTQDVPTQKKRLFQIPEAVNLSLIWFFYLIAAALLSVSEDYVTYCDSSASYHLQNQVREVAYAVTLVYSTSRCLRVSSDAHREGQGISWYSYAMNNTGENSCGAIRKQNRVLTIAVFVIGFRVIMAVLFIYEKLAGRLAYNADTCKISYSDHVSTISVFGRAALEVFTVAVYATGPQKNEMLKSLRYCLLVISFVLFIALTDIAFQPLKNSAFQPLRSYALPGVDTNNFSYYELPLVHVMFVTLLGICEPLRTTLNRDDVSDRLHHP